MEQNQLASVQTQDQREPLKTRAYSPRALLLRRFFRNPLAVIGLGILAFMLAFSFLGGLLSPYTQSQVFRREEMVWQAYAQGTRSAELILTSQPDADFSQAAFAEAVLAVSKAEDSFSYAGQTYTLTRSGADFYTIGASVAVAEARLLANRFSIASAEGSGTLSPPFVAAAQAAIENGQPDFLLGGTNYTVESQGKTFVVHRSSTVALATTRVYDPTDEAVRALVEGFAFRFACENALAGGQSSFVCDGASYVLKQNGAELLVLRAGTEQAVCAISDIRVSPAAGGAELPYSFHEAFRAAIRAEQSSFAADDGSGERKEYRVERGNNSYTVRVLTSSPVIALYESPGAAHPLGTDGNGMDVLTRLMYGGRISLMVGFVVVLIQLVLGALLGGISGYFGGWVDLVLMRIVDLVNSVPFYPLVIILGAALDQLEIEPVHRIFLLMALLGVLGWTGIARVVRGQVLSLREQEFLLAAEATGIRASRRILRHLLPSVMPLMIVQATINLGEIILTEATLSFLGLGVKYPLASWGSIVNAATDVHVMTNYWFVWIPAGLLIVLTVLGFNFVGDGLRDAYDPRRKR